MIQKKEAEKRLKEDKYFKDFNEHAQYRFEVVEEFLSRRNILINKIKLYVTPITNDNDRRAACAAFNMLKESINKNGVYKNK